MLPDESLSHTPVIGKVAAWKLFADNAAERLLVSSPRSVCFYGLDGKRQERVSLPKYMDASHALVTADGRIYVCHTGANNEFPQVTEIDIKGNVLRACGGPKGSDVDKFSSPAYLDLDANGRLFVVDQLNGRVALLDSNLILERVLQLNEGAEMTNLPSRVRYLPHIGKLLIATNKGAIIIYNLLGNKQQLLPLKY